MKRSIIALTLALTACAPLNGAVRYAKAGTTQPQMHTDYLSCQYEATKAMPNPESLDQGLAQVHLNDMCMQLKGYLIVGG